MEPELTMTEVCILLGQRDVAIFQLNRRVEQLIELNQSAGEMLGRLLQENESLKLGSPPADLPPSPDDPTEPPPVEKVEG